MAAAFGVRPFLYVCAGSTGKGLFPKLLAEIPAHAVET
jgi:hypothetical protein